MAAPVMRRPHGDSSAATAEWDAKNAAANAMAATRRVDAERNRLCEIICGEAPLQTILSTITKSDIETGLEIRFLEKQAMISRLKSVGCLLLLALAAAAIPCQSAPFRVLAFYSTNVEGDHVDFARQAIPFFQEMAKRDRFTFRTTTNWDDLNPAVLKDCDVVIWLDEFPHTPGQRAAFADYM